MAGQKTADRRLRVSTYIDVYTRGLQNVFRCADYTNAVERLVRSFRGALYQMHLTVAWWYLVAFLISLG